MPLKVNSSCAVLYDGWSKYSYTARITRKDTAACAIYAAVCCVTLWRKTTCTINMHRHTDCEILESSDETLECSESGIINDFGVKLQTLLFLLYPSGTRNTAILISYLDKANV
jgi:hypothetical protein